MPYIYPQQFEISAIEPNLVLTAQQDRLGFQIMPERFSPAFKIRWTQQDNYFGLQQLRGLDGRPSHVKRVGAKTYEYEPGVYGEFHDITESELLTRAGSITDPTVAINIDDLMVSGDQQLIQRELDRKESSIWAVLTTGTITIHMQGASGLMIGFTDTFPILTFSAINSWGGAPTTATPMKDFQAVQQLGIPAGVSNDFGAGATAYANSVTWNNMLFNQNNADLNGRRAEGGATFNTVDDISRLYVSRNLPTLKTYDNGYLNYLSVFTKFIPDNKVVVVAKRPAGAVVGEYRTTRNSHPKFNMKGGSYRYVIDRANGVNGEVRTPANIEIHRGHNGGPVMYYPGAVAVMNV